MTIQFIYDKFYEFRHSEIIKIKYLFFLLKVYILLIVVFFSLSKKEHSEKINNKQVDQGT